MPRRGENIYKRKDGRREARYIKDTALDGIKKYGYVCLNSAPLGTPFFRLFLQPGTLL